MPGSPAGQPQRRAAGGRRLPYCSHRGDGPTCARGTHRQWQRVAEHPRSRHRACCWPAMSASAAAVSSVCSSDHVPFALCLDAFLLVTLRMQTLIAPCCDHHHDPLLCSTSWQARWTLIATKVRSPRLPTPTTHAHVARLRVPPTHRLMHSSCLLPRAATHCKARLQTLDGKLLCQPSLPLCAVAAGQIIKVLVPNNFNCPVVIPSPPPVPPPVLVPPPVAVPAPVPAKAATPVVRAPVPALPSPSPSPSPAPAPGPVAGAEGTPGGTSTSTSKNAAAAASGPPGQAKPLMIIISYRRNSNEHRQGHNSSNV